MLVTYGGTVVFDEKSKSPKATITIKANDPTITIGGKVLGPGTYHIWFENSDSIKAKIDLVHKYNIKGTGSWSLGQENPVIWNDYKTWMTTHSSIPQNVTIQQPSPSEKQTALYPTYTVQSGDTLWKIATNFGLTVDQLKQYNYLTSDIINVGQVLYIVPPPTQTVPTVGTETNQTQVEQVKAMPTVTPTSPPVKPTNKVVKKDTLAGKLMVPKANKTHLRSGAESTNKIIKTLSTKNQVKVLSEHTDPKGIFKKSTN